MIPPKFFNITIYIPEAGLEPARPQSPRILSPVCLPFHHPGDFEVSAGFEPAVELLQSPALPLGDDTTFK